MSVRFSNFKKRVGSGLVAVTFVATQGVLLLNPAAVHAATTTVTYCEATGIPTNPYQEKTESTSFPFALSHAFHFADIIPANASGLTRNADANGLAVLAAHCLAGSLNVHKAIDANGNNIYNYLTGDLEANLLGERWGSDIDGGTARLMGLGVAPIAAGNRTVSEVQLPGFSYAGWFTTGSPTYNCMKPEGTQYPIPVTVTNGKISDVTICNTKRLGSLTIVKDATPNSLADFHFTTSSTGTPVTDFSLDDDAGIVDPSTALLPNTKTLTGLKNGVYTVSEDATAGWDLSTLSCNNAAAVVAGNKVTFTNIGGLSATCTYSNTQRGTIEIKKAVVGNAVDKFNLNIENTAYVNGAANSNGVGNGGTTGAISLKGGEHYIITETAVAGTNLANYASTYVCTDNGNPLASGNGTSVANGVVLGAGHAVVCTFTNTQLKASISVEKFAYTPDANGQSTKANPLKWHFVLTGPTNTSGDTSTQNGTLNFANLDAGNYTLCESTSSGWTRVAVDGSVLASNCEAFTVTPGQAVTKTFYNFKNTKISGFKFHDLNGDGTFDQFGWSAEPKIGNWTITVTKNGQPFKVVKTSNTIFNYGNYAVDTNGPGTYKVCEEDRTLDGWQVIPYSINQNDLCYTFVITQSGAQGYTAVFGNQAIATIEVKKNVDLWGDSQPEVVNSTHWSWNYLGIGNFNAKGNIQTGTTVTVPTGIFGNLYYITENQKDGYDLSNIDCGKTPVFHIGDGVKVLALRGMHIECTFTNTKLAEVTIEKEAHPADGTDFKFELKGNHEFDKFKLDDAHPSDQDGVHSTKTFQLKKGAYTITEKDIPAGWNLSDIKCHGTNEHRHGNSVELYVSTGDKIHCTFTNKKDATVEVTKFNDYNQNGKQDADEPVVPNWESFTLAQTPCSKPPVTILEEAQPLILNDSKPCYNDTENTDADGIATFAGVNPDKNYELTESIPQGTNWHLSGMYCDGRHVGWYDGEGTLSLKSWSIVPGSTVHCYVGNYRDASLLLTKSISSTTAKTGDVLTNTLTVTVPEDSGAIYDALVTDLPPEGFKYVVGSWTATSGGETVPVEEPHYGSPGIWHLGTLLPGQIIVLTYKTLVGSSVSSGNYNSIAFGQGCGIQANGSCATANIVFANVSSASNSPFVTTAVSVGSPFVATVTTHYVNTGAGDIILNTIAAITLVGAAAITLVRREQKGTK